MPDRLAELRSQRALIAEHLAWLDREIAAAAPASAASAVSSTPPAAPAPVTPPGVATTDPLPVPSPSPIDVAAILAAATAPKPAAQVSIDPSPESEVDATDLPSKRQPADIQQDVRRGCLLYFAIAALLVIGLCAVLVWVSQIYKKSYPPAPPSQEQFEERR